MRIVLFWPIVYFIIDQLYSFTTLLLCTLFNGLIRIIISTKNDIIKQIHNLRLKYSNVYVKIFGIS